MQGFRCSVGGSAVVRGFRGSVGGSAVMRGFRGSGGGGGGGFLYSVGMCAITQPLL